MLVSNRVQFGAWARIAASLRSGPTRPGGGPADRTARRERDFRLADSRREEGVLRAAHRVGEPRLVVVAAPLPVERKLRCREPCAVGLKPIDVVVVPADEGDRSVREHRELVDALQRIEGEEMRHVSIAALLGRDSHHGPSNEADRVDAAQIEVGANDRNRVGIATCRRSARAHSVAHE